MKLERIQNRTLVSLRVHRKYAGRAQTTLALADPLSSIKGETLSLWIGPNHWLLISETESSEAIIQRCTEALHDVFHHVSDQSAGYVSFRLHGQTATTILESGCGIDLRPAAFPSGSVRRTRLAQVVVKLIAIDEKTFEIIVDRSLAEWLQQWLTETAEILAADR